MMLIGPIRRRTFLASLLATCTINARRGAAHEYGEFTVGIQSYTFRKFPLEAALKRTRDLGLTSVEFYRGHVPTESSPEQLRAVLKLCQEYGVKPIAFGVERFTNHADKNRKLFEFAAALGVKHMSADPDPDSFDSLDRLCEEFKISIAIHPHGPAGGGKLHRWYGSEVILPAVKNHHPLIGTCLDTGHLIRSAQLDKKLDPADEIRAMGARNFGLHLKDHDNQRKTDVIFGQGSLDIPSILKALRDVRFAGYISVEYEANPGDPSPDVKACLDLLRKVIRS
jgi:sugar phosphate isomerase/epimerase